MAIEHTIDSPFAEAVRIMGSQSAMARLVNKSQATVHEHLKRGNPCWAESVVAVSKATGIPKLKLRPDLAELFADEEPAPPALPPIGTIDEVAP